MTSPDLVLAGLVEAQSSLDPTTQWKLRPGTVTVAGETSFMALLDGEGFQGERATDVPVISLVGYVSAGARVMVATVPPNGNYAISRIFGPTDSAWTDYSPTLTAAVSNPDVGAGVVLGRWLPIGWRTIAVEGDIQFGAGTGAGNGRYFVSAPFLVAPRSITAATGACYMFDSGTANRAGIINVTSAGDSYFITNTPNGDVANNVPQTWADGDAIRFSIIHEVASFDPL